MSTVLPLGSAPQQKSMDMQLLSSMSSLGGEIACGLKHVVSVDVSLDLCSALEVMKAARLRPNRDIAFHVLRGCFENNRPDLAVAFCRYPLYRLQNSGLGVTMI